MPMDPLEKAKLNGEMERLAERLEAFMAKAAPGHGYLLVHFGEDKQLKMITSLDQGEAAAILKVLVRSVGGDA